MSIFHPVIHTTNWHNSIKLQSTIFFLAPFELFNCGEGPRLFWRQHCSYKTYVLLNRHLQKNDFYRTEDGVRSDFNIVIELDLVLLILYPLSWSQVTHICVGNPTIIASDNGLLPSRHQAIIIWTNAGILLIRPFGTNFSEKIFSLKKMPLKMSAAKWRLFCPGLNVLMSEDWFSLH